MGGKVLSGPTLHFSRFPPLPFRELWRVDSLALPGQKSVPMKKAMAAMLFGLLVVLDGCAAGGPGRMEPTGIRVETVPTSVASVSRSGVYLDEGRLLVTGTLRRLQVVKRPGHIDIAVCGPEGLLARKIVTSPRLWSKRKGVMNLLFSARFNLIPPPGSKVLVRYHAQPVESEEVLRCFD